MEQISIKYRNAGKYKFILAEAFIADLPELGTVPDARCEFVQLIGGRLYIRWAYAWDGSSVPLKGLLKFLHIWDVDRHTKIASLVHDGLCQLIRLQKLPMIWKPIVDEVYRVLCIREGTKEKVADIMYEALRKWGDAFVRPNPNDPRDEILEASLCR
ncbi:MAG: hypothetical protein JXA04_01280 [Gammaproteobacteria bacterium]|nr:hypothetical protein [Gammaproteobacteria bacterium]